MADSAIPVTAQEPDATKKSKRARDWKASRASVARKIKLNTRPAQKTYRRQYEVVSAYLMTLCVQAPIKANNPTINTAITEMLKPMFDDVSEDLKRELERMSALFEANGIAEDEIADYSDVQHIEAEITTPWAGKFLKMHTDLDRLLMMIDTLWLSDVLDDLQRNAAIRRWSRRVAKLGGKVRNASEQTLAAIRRQVEETDASSSDSDTGSVRRNPVVNLDASVYSTGVKPAPTEESKEVAAREQAAAG